MADDIRSLSAALARDPSSFVYLELADALRRRGKSREALQVAQHGISRHPEHADGLDCLARIHADLGQYPEARQAWERALAIEPEHGGALKGIGFLYYRQGDNKRAIEVLEHAVAANPDDDSAKKTLTMLKGGDPSQRRTEDPDRTTGSRTTRDARSAREAQQDIRREDLGDAVIGSARDKTPDQVPQLRATAASLLANLAMKPEPEPPQQPAAQTGRRADAQKIEAPVAPARAPVFAGLEGATADILLLDPRGLVLAGGLKAPDGSDVSELAAAALAGVSGEAARTAGYLKVGAWTSIVAEAEQASVVLAPVGDGSLLMLRREKSTPVGLVLRIAERAKGAAARWLEEQA